MKDLSTRGAYAETFEHMLKHDLEQEAQVWVGSRRKFVRMDAQGLWLPLGAEQGFWAADVEHAQKIAARRGWAPCHVHQLAALLGHWPWEMAAKDVPVRAVDSPLGGVFLLPDPDESRPAKALAEACAPDEFRWLPVRPAVKPSQQHLHLCSHLNGD